MLFLSNTYHDIFLLTSILHKSCKTAFVKTKALWIHLMPQGFFSNAFALCKTAYNIAYSCFLGFCIDCALWNHKVHPLAFADNMEVVITMEHLLCKADLVILVQTLVNGLSETSFCQNEPFSLLRSKMPLDIHIHLSCCICYSFTSSSGTPNCAPLGSFLSLVNRDCTSVIQHARPMSNKNCLEVVPLPVCDSDTLSKPLPMGVGRQVFDPSYLLA
jgi:hypothetical protein